MSYIGISVTLGQAQSLLQDKFREISLQELENSVAPRRYYPSFLLHSRKCTQPPKMSRSYNKNAASKKTSSEIVAAHDFFLFGLPETQFCICVYTKAASETAKFLHFELLFPGQSVALVLPKIQGKQTGTDNLIVSSSEPLIPLKEPLNLIRTHLPPVISDSPDYRFFHYRTSSFAVEDPFAITKRCNGVLYDGSCSISQLSINESTWKIYMGIEIESYYG